MFLCFIFVSLGQQEQVYGEAIIQFQSGVVSSVWKESGFLRIFEDFGGFLLSILEDNHVEQEVIQKFHSVENSKIATLVFMLSRIAFKDHEERVMEVE